MIKKTWLYVSFYCVLVSSTHSFCQVRVLLSAALTDSYFKLRKAQYVHMFEQLKAYGYPNPYVVEALKKRGPTFLDEYSSNVFYSDADIAHLRNKGINEARTTLQGTYFFNFDSEDIVLKMTGRYEFISDYFLRTVEEKQDDFDAFVKVDKNGDVYTLGFAMRCKYYREMYETMNFKNLERYSINLETAVGNYVKHKLKEGNFRVYYMDKLDIKARLLGSSASPGAPDETLIY